MRQLASRLFTHPNSALFLVLIAAFSRLIPHPPNFTPVLSIALFSGAVFPDRWRAFAVPLLGMLLSNVVLGFYTISWVVIGLITSLAFLGRFLRPVEQAGGEHPEMPNTRAWLLSSILAALMFFAVSNFFVWLLSGYYPQTWQGLLTCYGMAIPFFQNTLISTILYSAVLFEGQKLALWLTGKANTPTPV